MKLRTSAVLKGFAVFLFLLVVLSLAYWPAIQGYYAHHDDFYYWAWNPEDFRTHPQYGIVLSVGRYLGMVFFLGYGTLIKNIRQVNLVRFISVVNLSLCGLLWFYWLRKYHGSWWLGVLVAPMLFTFPPFQVHVAWATCAFITASVLLASLAGLLAFKVPDSLPPWKLPLSGHALAAVGLMIASLATYQTGAMFYWVMIAGYLLGRGNGPSSRQRRVLFNTFCLGFVGIALYAAMVRIVQALILKPSVRHSVYNVQHMTSDPLGKLSWFIKEPLTNVLNLWNVFPTRNTAIIVAMIIASGIVLKLVWATLDCTRKKASATIFLSLGAKAVLLCVLLLLSFLPNLIAATNAAYYRTLMGPAVIVIFLLIWTATQWMRLLPRSLQKPVMVCLLAVLCGYGVYKAHKNVNDYITCPASMELRYIEAVLREQDFSQPQRIHVIRPTRPIVAAQWRYDEFAAPTTCFPQDVPWIIRAALQEIKRGEIWEHVEISSSVEGDLENPDQGAILIDMTKLQAPC